MRESWRWFGAGDPVGLDDIRQTGATDVVCALYEIPAGEEWPVAQILALKSTIETTADGRSPLRWRVVESVPVHEDIKLGRPTRDRLIATWAQTLENLAGAGIEVVCYNFMPVIDWTRTDLAYRLPSGARTLRFEQRAYAVFDLHILKRADAGADYTDAELAQAASDYSQMSEARCRELTENIVAGLPGRMTDSYDLDAFRAALGQYADIDRQALEANLDYFLEGVLPTAERCDIRLAIHPDDPPWSLFGLPRVVCNAGDVARILDRHTSTANGLALCAGTFGSHVDNNVPAMARQFGAQVHFAHLRSVQRDADEPRTFFESAHLAGQVDLVETIRQLLQHEAAARAAGDAGRQIFVRPDHGHQMLDDLGKTVNPGYSAIGRVKGLAEVRGVIRALESGPLPAPGAD